MQDWRELTKKYLNSYYKNGQNIDRVLEAIGVFNFLAIV